MLTLLRAAGHSEYSSHSVPEAGPDSEEYDENPYDKDVSVPDTGPGSNMITRYDDFFAMDLLFLHRGRCVRRVGAS